MLFQDRGSVRKVFIDTWAKMQAGAELEPLEGVVAAVIARHPEYHHVLSGGAAVSEQNFDVPGQTNPFLHMGLHIALLEQVQTDRPPGIAALYKELLFRGASDPHAVEHRILDCLAAVLWSAQRNNTLPDDQAYLETLRRLAGAV